VLSAQRLIPARPRGRAQYSRHSRDGIREQTPGATPRAISYADAASCDTGLLPEGEFARASLAGNTLKGVAAIRRKHCAGWAQSKRDRSLRRRGVAAVPSCHCPLRCAWRALATVPVVLAPLAAEESMLTDERIIESGTAAMSRILCRAPQSRHPETCTKLSGLTGEAVARARWSPCQPKG